MCILFFAPVFFPQNVKGSTFLHRDMLMFLKLQQCAQTGWSWPGLNGVGAALLLVKCIYNKLHSVLVVVHMDFKDWLINYNGHWTISMPYHAHYWNTQALFPGIYFTLFLFRSVETLCSLLSLCFAFDQRLVSVVSWLWAVVLHAQQQRCYEL